MIDCIINLELSLGVSIQQQQQQFSNTQKNDVDSYPPVNPHMPYFYYGDYHEKSIGIESFSKSLGLFGENGKNNYEI